MTCQLVGQHMCVATTSSPVQFLVDLLTRTYFYFRCLRPCIGCPFAPLHLRLAVVDVQDDPDSGLIYYYHAERGESVWEKPTEPQVNDGGSASGHGSSGGD
eukprot:SAG31_NODE_10046_length_1191_cov_1.441392_1_plen_100_part_10